MAENRDRKPRSRRAYLRDFQADESGSYEYRGKILRSSRDPADYRSRLLKAAAAFGAVLAVQLAAGFLPGTGMEGHPLMLLPYALGIGCAVRILWILVRLMRNGPELRGYVYDATAAKLPGYLTAAQVLAFVSLFDAALNAVRGTLSFQGTAQGTPSLAAPIVFLLSQVLLAAAAASIRKSKPDGEWTEN